MKEKSSLALAEAIVADGFTEHCEALTQLLNEARDLFVDELLVNIVADASNAPVVRERALGRVIVALEYRRP